MSAFGTGSLGAHAALLLRGCAPHRGQRPGSWTGPPRPIVTTLEHPGLHSWRRFQGAGTGICTRPGAHCAPMWLELWGTEGQGSPGFSSTHFNTEEKWTCGHGGVRELAS